MYVVRRKLLILIIHLGPTKIVKKCCGKRSLRRFNLRFNLTIHVANFTMRVDTFIVGNTCI
jgi:hypothetical protein